LRKVKIFSIKKHSFCRKLFSDREDPRGGGVEAFSDREDPMGGGVEACADSKKP
jgi:hypothetical protein